MHLNLPTRKLRTEATAMAKVLALPKQARSWKTHPPYTRRAGQGAACLRSESAHISCQDAAGPCSLPRATPCSLQWDEDPRLSIQAHYGANCSARRLSPGRGCCVQEPGAEGRRGVSILNTARVPVEEIPSKIKPVVFVLFLNII